MLLFSSGLERWVGWSAKVPSAVITVCGDELSRDTLRYIGNCFFYAPEPLLYWRDSSQQLLSLLIIQVITAGFLRQSAHVCSHWNKIQFEPLKGLKGKKQKTKVEYRTTYMSLLHPTPCWRWRGKCGIMTLACKLAMLASELNVLQANVLDSNRAQIQRLPHHLFAISC